MVLAECGGYTINSDFDSGNLGRVELVKKYTDEIFSPSADPLSHDNHHHPTTTTHPSLPLPPTVNVEINVWTRRDCEGTPHENGNRTWFFFSVKGGQPSHILRVNVMNLNRQAKLYSQGMHPVIKIGTSGKWERHKDRPSYRFDDDENFVMSFVHRAGVDSSVEHFYAFTFPYTYKEQQDYLSRLDRRFRKRMFDVQKKSLEENICLFVDSEDLDGITLPPSTPIPGLLNLAPVNASLLYRRDSLGGESCSSNPELLTADDLYNEIYYCRELLTYSVEQRRIDLITITSYHGISAEREKRLSGLFPENLRHRCHTFKNKKTVFLSSRVHPGETPASFVLNGFIKLLLDRKSQIAAQLRRLYVFKIVPFLNPDGVYNGLYRSDTLGHNLNRVYINPDPKKHPSIYAVRRLLRFYQYGCENVPEEGHDEEAVNEITSECCHQVSSLKEIILNQLNRSQSSEEKELPPPTMNDDNLSSPVSPEILVTVDIVTDENSTPPPLTLPPSSLIDSNDVSDNKSDSSARTSKSTSSSGQTRGEKKLPPRKETSKNKSVEKIITNPPKKEFKRKASPKATIMSARYKGSQDVLKDNKAAESMIGHLSQGIDFHNLYNHFEHEQQQEQLAKVEDKTNLFLYIDLHGHASKNGVFMFGNHLPHPMQAVECMLLPRLMSLNSHHFHFDACNFSERNMYHKGKRDGLSKEGSGRVAVYKSTGLIKCYTLECNYNTGKYVNVLPARGKDKAPRAVNLVPPKYTPAIFEEVGRSLGPSILDLTNSNPISRLPNSEFRTLQGLRNALRLQIEKTFSKNQLLLKAAKGKLKRLKSVLNDPEMHQKENKRLWTAPANRTISCRTGHTIKGGSKYATGGGEGSSSGSTVYGKKERAAAVTRKKEKKPPVVSDTQLSKEGGSSSSVPLLNLGQLNRFKGNSLSEDLLSAIPSTSSSENSSSSGSARPSVKNITKGEGKRASGIPVYKRPTPTTLTQSICSNVPYAAPSTSKGGAGGSVLLRNASVPTANRKGSVLVASTGTATGKKLAIENSSGASKLKTKRPLKPDALMVKRKKCRAKWH